MSSILSIGKIIYTYPAFLILHFVFASLSCAVGGLSYFWKQKIPNFWHHFFYFFVLLTGLISFLFCLQTFSFALFSLGLNLILLTYLPIQKKGIVMHVKLGFSIWGLALVSLILGSDIPY